MIVGINGCFDVLHLGHIRLLSWAAGPDRIIYVGINSDESVRKLKGEGRPINTAANRAMMLESIRFVNHVRIFDEPNAANFIRSIRPQLYVKGDAYNWDNINAEEKDAINEVGAIVIFAPTLKDMSTTAILEKIHKL